MPTSSGFLRALSGCFHGSDRVWWVVVLHAIRPPLSDPIHWLPDLEDYGFLDFLLDELESLDIPRDDFVPLAHYPLARLVDDVLMSSAFAECGAETVERWRTPGFYDHLLKEDLPTCVVRGTTSVARAQALIARILRILENHGLARLRLGIGAGTLYYGLRDEALHKTREAFLEYLCARDIAPCLLDTARAGLFQPFNGALVPDFERLKKVEHSLWAINGVLGPFDLTLPLRAIRPDKESSPPDAAVEEYRLCYDRWHYQGARSG